MDTKTTPKTNAQIQAEYRKRHTEYNDDHKYLRRVNMMIDLDAKLAIDRLTSYYAVTKLEIIQRALYEMEKTVLLSLVSQHQNNYYDKALKQPEEGSLGFFLTPLKCS